MSRRTAPWLRIGIDVGGTNTDAVALDSDDRLVARAKRPTSDDVTGGMRAALAVVLAELGARAGDVRSVMVGTTHATNAVVGRRDLAKVGVLRIGASVTAAVPPLADWPEDLHRAAVAGTAQVDGGHLIDGYPVAPLDVEAVKRFLGDLAGRAQAIAVTGVFSPVHPEHELRVADLVRTELGPGVHTSMGHQIGALGLLARENSTVLNAALRPTVAAVTSALGHALDEHGLDVATYFTQNDGTLMDAAHADRFPLLTIGSGPSNSLRGAALLTGLAEAVVADVGGTTTDLGVLVDGFARESAAGSVIGGVRTNLPMPDVLSIAYGGGTVVYEDRTGPESVDRAITAHALVFGGATPTLTDAAVFAGRLTLGDRARLGSGPGGRLKAAVEDFDQHLSEAVSLVSHGRRDQPVVAVGGAAGLIPATVDGHSVERPRHADVANAVGAALALVSGEHETVVPAGSGRLDALEEARETAVARAVAAGADPVGTAVVRIREVPLSYGGRRSIRVAVKAVGPLAAPS
ncbi:hydantoinase/oxoprolinase family protein [Streptomyces sp. V4I2]|uniref:hydantoinase/oxoprolinase family protein n=1 Tax=Streptomyces sp. V4I2 TaxID=3042280 RepID=UPI0027810F6C|nr:hydantoinase/oxoprolinase family protein [Streptomyces sp. V4I2]MDQ1044687.1 N-methylhydantoinase A/oxoprolinase/acetone carboxylase beta subunit [Streptomyces sp. V4I2]